MDKLKKTPTMREASEFFENQTDAEWMTIEEIAAHLRTKVSHIRELVYRDEIPHSKLGRLLRFHRQTVDDWMISR